MLSVEQALQLVLDHARPLPPRKVPAFETLGCVLAESIVSDIDSPPHDKSIVDGYAVIAADIKQAGVELTVVEEIMAGAVPERTVTSGACSRIMTGAPVPAGADAIVMSEQTEQAGPRVRFLQSPVRPGQNIMPRAASLTKGQTVLESGRRLRGIELGLLAEVGIKHVPVFKRPKVLIIATGNELVDFWETPSRGQIRNSNSLLMWGLATEAGAFAGTHGISRDQVNSLREKILQGLSSDVLLLSGGVSAGVLDLVPQVLTELGVQQVFHKVNLKPGKPLWFGVKKHDDAGRQTLVFGLPGNPVSGLVCFELFVRPAIEKLSSREPTGLPRVTAILTQEHKQRGDRPTYWPAIVRNIDPRILPSCSQELRTPLTSIIGFAEVLEHADNLSDLQRRMAGNIHRSGRILKDMIEDLLGLAAHHGESKALDCCATVTPLPWQGSGDLRTLTDANCMAYFPAGDRVWSAGEKIEVLLMN